MNNLTTKMILAAGLGALAILPLAKADSWNQKTVLTLSSPLEIPGQTLAPGTYVFKLANSQTSRHIVQVFNKDENKVLATFLAIPAHRQQAAEQTIIRYHERPAGSPQAIQAWFYPGKTTGHEFVYLKDEAIALARANNLPVPAMPMELITTVRMPELDLNAPEIEALTNAPLKLEEPSGQEVQIAALFVAPLEEPPALPEELPHTASWAPLIGLAGLALVSVAGLLRLRTGGASWQNVKS